MKKGKFCKIRILCLVTLILLLCSSTSNADLGVNGVSTVTSQTYNVMLLIDKSGSMVATDPGKVALDAGCQFVDQLCMTYSNLATISNVGVMAFSQTTELISPLSDLSIETNRELLKNDINTKIGYNEANTGGTDLKAAIYDAALELQKGKRENSKNIIVMFTDGYSEDVLEDQEFSEKRDKLYSITKDLECEVFIVGLNYKGKIKPKGQEEIYQIADTLQLGEGIESAAENDSSAKGEKVNYLIANNMNNVREFYGKIYAYMIGGGLEFLDNHTFDITTSGVQEADVTVYSDSEITELSILNPDGKEMKEDGKNCFISGEKFYKVIKIMNPELGTWTIKVKSTDKYKSYVIRFYGIETAINATWGKNKEFNKVNLEDEYVGQVIVTPMYKSEPYTDESVVKSFTTAEYVVDDGETSETYPLVYNTEEKYFEGYFPVITDDYHITANLANDNMNRTVECDLNVNTDIFKKDGKYSYDLDTINVKNGKSKKVNLGDINGIPNLTIQTAVTDSSKKTNNQEIVSTVEQKGSVITIFGRQTGKDKIKVSAVDEEGNKYVFSGAIKVKFAFHWYHLYYIIAVIILFVICFVVIRRKIMRVDGKFEIYIKNEESSIENTIGNYPRGKEFSLWRLIECVIESYEGHPPCKEQDLCDMLKKEKEKIALHKIIICNDESRRIEKRSYKFKGGGPLNDLKSKTVCYKSTSTDLQISIKFKPLRNEFEDEEDWGKSLEEIPAKHKKIGRTSTRKF